MLQVEGAEPVPGFDYAGVVEKVGFLSDRFKIGDRLWGFAGHGAMAEYIVRPTSTIGMLPPALDATTDEVDAFNMTTVGSLPTVGITMAGALRTAGAPWTVADNTTVIITAGNGGTGWVSDHSIVYHVCVACEWTPLAVAVCDWFSCVLP